MEIRVIDINVPLRLHDYNHQQLQDVAGKCGVVVVGVGKAGERGFQMLYRFSDTVERLEHFGINVIFVYPKESAHHALDTTSLLSARYHKKTCLFLDDDGRFFRQTLGAKSLRAVYLDREMKQVSTVEVTLKGEAWDPELRAFLAQIASSCMH